MKRIEIISASAGSGKTYRLAEALHGAIDTGRARPEAICATTFTNKAAAELEERVRAGLLRAGKASEAERLAVARIGTVNSVCGALLREFAFELGLQPEPRVLEPRLAELALQRSISAVVTRDEEEELAELRERLEQEFDWRALVRSTVDLARTNGLGAPDLGDCARRSLESMSVLFRRAGDAGAIERALLEALDDFARLYDPARDTTNKTAEVAESVREAQRLLRAGRPLPWRIWAKLCSAEVGVKSAALYRPVAEAASAHDMHPGLRADAEKAVQLVFTLAERALSAYQEQKRTWGRLDFVDQEVLALKLLRQPEVREQLAAELDLVLVDEFQDTSPLQLAIFLELASLAPHSIWVGDQKQSIYGFRGADPALMDAAIEALLGGREPQTLDRSWRSRPELVRLTSDLFAPAFAQQAIPEGRVRLEPARGVEPPGLGPVVERWNLTPAGRRKEQLCAPLATAIAALLADPRARVRDPATGEPRRPIAGDVAVLCFRNETAAEVAAQLERAGLRAVLPRAGLLATAEGQVAHAALRLWADDRDTLAMAQLARFIAYAGREDEWLEAALAEHDAAPFPDLACVSAVREARRARPLAGAVQALDAAIEAVGLRDLCLGWGDAGQRHANLDALRAQAVLYARSCEEQGAGATPAGLAAWFATLAAEGEDAQAVAVDPGSVVVSTWHGAKGLEWPIVVLYELEGLRPDTALGVRAIAGGAIDMDDPLAGRWIRYWPHPFHASQSSTPFHARLDALPQTAEVRQADARQRLRLLYVGWTRARDRVVLAARAGRLDTGILSVLCDSGGPLLSEPRDGRATWAGRPVDVEVRDVAAPQPVPREAFPSVGFDPRGPVEHPPAYVQPSGLALRGECQAPEQIGARIRLSGDPDMGAIGTALHALFAADLADLDVGERQALAAAILERWGVSGAIAPESAVSASDSLRTWIDRRWPGARWHREWPVLHRLPNGSVVRGSVDLALELDDRFVVVDHKSFPGGVESALERASSHAGQVAAYARAITAATGKPVLACFIHLPVSGLVVPLPALDAAAVPAARSYSAPSP